MFCLLMPRISFLDKFKIELSIFFPIIESFIEVLKNNKIDIAKEYLKFSVLKFS